MLIDAASGRLRYAAAPNLPQGYVAATGDWPSDAGPCGMAASHREPVIASDLANDTRWREYGKVASTHGIRACWSTPIISSKEKFWAPSRCYPPSRAARRPYRNTIEQVTHIASIAIERTLAEDELRRQKAHLDELFDMAPDAIVLTDLSHPRILRINNEFARVFGYAPEEAVGQRLRHLIVPDDVPPAGLADNPAVLAGKKVESEVVRRRKDGSRFHAHVTAKRVRFQGDDDAAYLIYRDISDSKRAEAALRLSEERYALAVQAAGEGHSDWNFETGGFFFRRDCWKFAATRRRRSSRIAPIGSRDFRFIPKTAPSGKKRLRSIWPGALPCFTWRFARSCAARRAGCGSYFCARGTQLASPFAGPAPPATSRTASAPSKSCARARKCSTLHRKLRKPLRTNGASTALTRRAAPSGRCARRRNSTRCMDMPWERSTAATRAGRSSFIPTIGRSQRLPQARPAIRRNRRGIPDRAAGRRGALAAIERQILFDANGLPERMVGFVLDITTRRKSEEELRRLEHQLRQAQRLEAMGTLAGGIAHDFNNILGAILGYGEMAMRDAPKGGRCIATSTASCRRANAAARWSTGF